MFLQITLLLALLVAPMESLKLFNPTCTHVLEDYYEEGAKNLRRCVSKLGHNFKCPAANCPNYEDIKFFECKGAKGDFVFGGSYKYRTKDEQGVEREFYDVTGLDSKKAENPTDTLWNGFDCPMKPDPVLAKCTGCTFYDPKQPPKKKPNPPRV